MGRGRRKARAREAAAYTTLHGIDVSRYQGAIDWSQVAGKPTAQGQQVQFAYIKATDGSQGVDSQFAANWCNSKGLLPRGVYHFFRASASLDDLRAQADNFTRAVQTQMAATGETTFELPPMVDVEWESLPAGVSADQAIPALQIFLAPVEQAFGMRPILYTAAAFWQEHMKDTRAFAQDYLLWIAMYGDKHAGDDGYDRPAVRPRPAGGWTDFCIWQSAVQQGVPGIAGLVDRDEIALPAGTTPGAFLAQLRGRTLLDREVRNALLESATDQDCLELDREGRLFKAIVADGLAPNSPEFPVAYGGTTYTAQRAERLDRDGVRVYYVGSAPGDQVRYVIRTGSAPAPGATPASLRDALLATAEAKLALRFNKDAGLQRRVAADGFLPVCTEFGLQFAGASYVAQYALQPATGQERVYYARAPEWGKVQFVARA